MSYGTWSELFQVSPIRRQAINWDSDDLLSIEL